jgi:hypothetical protein
MRAPRHRQQKSASARRQACLFKQKFSARSTRQFNSFNAERALNIFAIFYIFRPTGLFSNEID